MSSEYSALSDLEIATRIKNGETEAFTQLAGRYIPLIRFKARSFTGIETDDLYQEGLLSLLNAAMTFNEDKNIKFSTYAGACIHNRFVSLSRKNGSLKEIQQRDIDSLDNTDDFREPSAGNATDPELLVIERDELQHIRERLKSTLSPLETEVFHLYMNGYRYREIAKKLSVSEKTVDNAVVRIRKKLKSLCY